MSWSSTWSSTVVFKGSDNAKQIGRSVITDTMTVETHIKNVLDTFGIKDVLATVELDTGYGKRLPYTPEPDECFVEASKKFGYDTTIYTDASLPNK